MARQEIETKVVCATRGAAADGFLGVWTISPHAMKAITTSGDFDAVKEDRKDDMRLEVLTELLGLP